MIDEEEFISVLCMDGKWGFGRFCCELAEEYREPDLCKSWIDPRGTNWETLGGEISHGNTLRNYTVQQKQVEIGQRRDGLSQRQETGVEADQADEDVNTF